MKRFSAQGFSTLKKKMHFHDAILTHLELGPRREVQLEFLLDPVWNPDVSSRVMVLRCDAIANYSAVEKFFRAISTNVRVDRFEQSDTGVILDLDPNGSVEIVSQKVSFFQGTSAKDTA